MSTSESLWPCGSTRLLRSTGNCEALRDWVGVRAERQAPYNFCWPSEEATIAFWDKKVSIQKVKSRGQEVR